MTATVQALAWSLPWTTATLVSFGAVDRQGRNVGAVLVPYEAEILAGPWSAERDHLGRQARTTVVDPALVGTRVAMLWFQAARWSDRSVVPGEIPFALAWRMTYASNRERIFVGPGAGEAREAFVKEYLANGRKRAIKAHGFAAP